MSLNRPEGAVAEFKIAQDLRADIRSYQGIICCLFILNCFSVPNQSADIANVLLLYWPVADVIKFICYCHSGLYTRKRKNPG